MSSSIIEFANAAARLKGTISRLSDGAGGGGKPTEDMMLLEKQGRSSQRQRMTVEVGGEPRRAGSLPPSSLPRPPRALKATSANSRYCRLSDTETRKKSDPGPGMLDTSSGGAVGGGGGGGNGGGSCGVKVTRDSSGNCSIEYGRFDTGAAVAAKASRSRKKTSMENFMANSSLKKSSTGSGMTSGGSGGGGGGGGHEYERLQSHETVSNRKRSVCALESAVRHREMQSRSFIPPPSRGRIGEYGRLSDGEPSSSVAAVAAAAAAAVLKVGGNTLRKQTGAGGGGGSSRGQSTGSTVSSKSGRDSGGTASSEASTASLPPTRARSIPRPGNYRIQF